MSNPLVTVLGLAAEIAADEAATLDPGVTQVQAMIAAIGTFGEAASAAMADDPVAATAGVLVGAGLATAAGIVLAPYIATAAATSAAAIGGSVLAEQAIAIGLG
jgi:hypothetical protein